MRSWSNSLANLSRATCASSRAAFSCASVRHTRLPILEFIVFSKRQIISPSSGGNTLPRDSELLTAAVVTVSDSPAGGGEVSPVLAHAERASEANINTLSLIMSPTLHFPSHPAKWSQITNCSVVDLFESSATHQLKIT